MIHATIVLICMAQPDLTRHPYIRTLTSSSAAIVWKTDSMVTGSVDYGETQGLGRSVSGEAPTTVHAVTLTGLMPGTMYYYRPLGNGQPFTEASAGVPFTAAPEGSVPFSFIVFGDLGCGCAAQKALAEAMRSYEFSFALLTGDIVYPKGEAENYDPNFFDIYRGLIRSRPFYPSIGNHDVMTDNGRPYLDAFGKDRYYSFDYGGAHIVALDVFSSPYAADSVQYRWLEDDLKNTRAPWTFVFLHDPPYSSGPHGSNLSVRKTLSPLFERYGVSIVFAGHDHTYERTKPLREFVRDGHPVVYIVSGGGGGNLYPVGKNDFTAFSASRHNFVHVRVDTESAEVRAIGEDGTAFDTYALERRPVHLQGRSRGCGSIP